MTAVVFEPHPDDAVLFACWSILETRASIVTVCGDSHLQHWLGVDSETRRRESKEAATVLGVNHDAWPIRDDTPDWEAVHALMEGYDEDHKPAWVFAPAVEHGGNPAHSIIGDIARKVFGTRCTPYLTYTGSPGRKSRDGELVPFEQAWIPLKHKALLCYESQMLIESGAPRFFLDDLYEYRQRPR